MQSSCMELEEIRRDEKSNSEQLRRVRRER